LSGDFIFQVSGSRFFVGGAGFFLFGFVIEKRLGFAMSFVEKYKKYFYF